MENTILMEDNVYDSLTLEYVDNFTIKNETEQRLKKASEYRNKACKALGEFDYGGKSNPIIFQEQIFKECSIEFVDNVHVLFKRCVFIDVQLKGGTCQLESCEFKTDFNAIDHFMFTITEKSSHRPFIYGRLDVSTPPPVPPTGSAEKRTSITRQMSQKLSSLINHTPKKNQT